MHGAALTALIYDCYAAVHGADGRLSRLSDHRRARPDRARLGRNPKIVHLRRSPRDEPGAAIVAVDAKFGVAGFVAVLYASSKGTNQ